MASKRIDPPTIEELRSLFRYEPETGDLYWVAEGKGRIKKKPAGTKLNNGYMGVLIGGKRYYSHRVAWALHTGAWPEDQIDHINGVKTDNRIENLRAATNNENGKNYGFNSRNTSGVKGVYYDKENAKWMAQIKVDGRSIKLGRFREFDDAVAARKVAEDKHFGGWKRGNPCV